MAIFAHLLCARHYTGAYQKVFPILRVQAAGIAYARGCPKSCYIINGPKTQGLKAISILLFLTILSVSGAP